MRALLAVAVTVLLTAFTPAKVDRVFTVHLVCANGVDCLKAAHALTRARDFIEREVGIALKVKRLSFVKVGGMPPGEYSDIDIWKFVAGELKHKTDIVYVAVPMMQGIRLAGMAGCIGCASSGGAVAWGRVGSKDEGFDAATTAHEILHLFGARHVESRTIMHPTANDPLEKLHIDPVNVGQVREG